MYLQPTMLDALKHPESQEKERGRGLGVHGDSWRRQTACSIGDPIERWGQGRKDLKPVLKQTDA